MLRFSYDGTGDSSGTLEDPERVRAWEDSVVRAVGVLWEAGVDRVGAVGMRLGATLLTRAADVARPPAGRARAVGPLRQRPRVRALPAGPDGYPPRRARRRRDRLRHSRLLLPDVPGRRARPGGDRRAVGPGAPTLVLTRPEGSNRRLERALAGGRVELGRPPSVRRCCSTSRRSAPKCPDGPSGRSPDGSRDVWRDPRDRWWCRRPRRRRRRQWASTPAVGPSGSMRCASGDLGLFAIATEPEGGGRGPWMVFLNVATEHHIGPGRQWVELARAWAGHGLRSLRVDFSGVGDSPVRPGQVAERHLRPRVVGRPLGSSAPRVAPRDPSDTAWIGLCSGGYGALEAALMVGARGAYVLNPSLSSTSMNKSSARGRSPAQGLPSLPGAPGPAVGEARPHGRDALAGLPAGRRGPGPPGGAGQPVRAGIDVLLVCGPDDARPLRDSWYWRCLGEPRLRRTGRFELAVVPVPRPRAACSARVAGPPCGS